MTVVSNPANMLIGVKQKLKSDFSPGLYGRAFFTFNPHAGLLVIYLLRGIRRFRPAYVRLVTDGFPAIDGMVHQTQTQKEIVIHFLSFSSFSPSIWYQQQVLPLHLTTAHEVHDRSNARHYVRLAGVS